MPFWFGKKNSSAELRKVALPGDVGTVTLPAFLTTDFEEDDIWVAYPETGDITIRLSSISFVKKNSDEEDAKSFVEKRAAEEGHRYSDLGKKGIAEYEEPSEDNGVPLVIRYWHIGEKNTVVIVSATVVKQNLRTRTVRKTLKAMPSIVESITITKSHDIVVAEGKEIEITTETVDPEPQEILPFAEEQLAWLNENEFAARELSLKYGSGGELDPSELDRIFARWAADDDVKEAPETIVNVLGAAFGEYLVDSHGFSWVVVRDRLGTEYAVKHKIAETMAFPRSSIEKRIERGETEFFDNLYLAIVDLLKR